jgi:hypothetical protein
MAEKPDKLAVIRRQANGTFGPGSHANPKGRPKGKTIKERVAEWLEEHPEDMQSFVRHFVKNSRELAWQMLEGKPQQDVTSGGEKINPVPILQIPNALPGNNSNKKDHGAQSED